MRKYSLNPSALLEEQARKISLLETEIMSLRNVVNILELRLEQVDPEFLDQIAPKDTAESPPLRAVAEEEVR